MYLLMVMIPRQADQMNVLSLEAECGSSTDDAQWTLLDDEQEAWLRAPRDTKSGLSTRDIRLAVESPAGPGNHC